MTSFLVWGAENTVFRRSSSLQTSDETGKAGGFGYFSILYYIYCMMLWIST